MINFDKRLHNIKLMPIYPTLKICEVKMWEIEIIVLPEVANDNWHAARAHLQVVTHNDDTPPAA